MPMLANATKPSLLSTLKLPRPLNQDATRFVGIDIGSDRVHVASIGYTKRRRRNHATGEPFPQWMSSSTFALPIDPSEPPTVELVDLICATIAERLPRCVDGERNVVTLALPLPWVHYETTPLANLAESQTNCDSMFGASVFRSPASLSHWPVCDDQKQHVVAATADLAACRIASAVASVGYLVHSILPHAVALIHTARELTAVDPHSVLLLEPFGGLIATKSGGRCGMCRTLPAFEHRDGTRDGVDELEPYLEVIASEVTATSRYVSRLGSTSDPQAPVLICGSMAKIKGVDEALATMIRRPVATWRYVNRVRPDLSHSSSEDVAQFDADCAVALALAHCSNSRLSCGDRSR